MRSKSLAQPSAGFSHCLPLISNVPSKGRKALMAGMAMLAALSSVAAANAQSLVQVPIITTYAGTGSLTNTFSGDGGQATAAGINNPEGIAYDGKGNTYIADYYNQRIRVVSATGIINTVFGTGATCPVGAGNACGDGGPASAATFNNPSAMQFDAKGNLYIADYTDQRIRKITATNGTITGASIITTVAGTGAAGTTGNTGVATAATLYNPHGLALDAAGNLWISNQGQGVSCTIEYVPAANGVVQIGGVATAVTAAHIYLIAGQFNTCGYISDANGTTYGTASRLTSPTNVALDAAGNLYIGDYGNGRVRKLTMSTGIITTIAGTGFQACPVIAPNAAAPNPIPPCGDGGLATAAALNGPTGVYVDATGNIVIGDAFGARVREINATTGIISTIAGDSQQCTNITQTTTNAVYPTCGDGGAATKALVSFPILISVDPVGNIFYVDQYDNKIREILNYTNFPATEIGTTNPQSQNVLLQVTGTTGQTLTINSITVPLSPNGQPEYNVTGVTGCNATGTAANAVGTICTVNVTFSPQFPGNQNLPLTVVTSAGTFSFALNGVGVGPQAILTPPVLNTVAGTGTAGGPNSGVSAVTASLKGPSRVISDASGNLYIADTLNNVVSVVYAGGSGLASLIALEDGGAVATAGNLYTLAGTGTACAAPTATPACGDGGKATAATLNAPTDVVVDGAGNLYISDSKDNRVREVNANTGIITTVAGNGTAKFTADGVAPTSTGVGTPVKTVVAANGDLYIAAQSDHAVRFVAPGGLIRTYAGTEGTACAPPTTLACGDGGAATAAFLTSPSGLALDLNGNLYIADTGDNKIRLVNPAGGISTVAGTGAAGYTGDGGQALAATLNVPNDVYIDPSGTLLIADTGNKVIRQVLSSSQVIATVAGNGTACASATGACGDGGPSNVASLISPQSTTLDSAGDLFIADSGENRIRKLVGNPTILNFPLTSLGSTSALTANLQNIGNGTLTLSDPPLTNPSVSTNFNLGNATTCPQLTTTTATVAAGANCLYSINFAPLTAAGNYTGQLVETDNSLNATAATQIINFTAKAQQVPSTTDTLTATPSPSSYGTPETLTFCIPVVAGVAVPDGTVTFSIPTNPSLGASPVTVGTTPTTFNGQSCYLATTTTANLPVGTDTITGTFTAAPDSGYASGAPTTTVTVAKDPVVQPPGGPTALNDTFTATPATQVFGMPVTLTYTIPVAAGNAVPTGPVTFTYGTGTPTVLGSCGSASNPPAFAAGTTFVLSGITYTNYSCSTTTTVLPVGSDTVSAIYPTTDPNYAGGTLTAPVTVTTATAQATLTAGPNPATFGTPVTITETLVPINGICPPGPVSFFNNGTLITGTVNGTVNPATVGANCVASITTNTLPVGTDDITATAPASGSFGAVTSGPLPVVINKANGADTLTTAPNPSTFGQNVLITDTIPTALAGTVPTGTVQFYDYGTAIGTPQPVSAAGVATLNITTLPVGTDSITGVYSGDANYATMTSNAVNQIVTAVSSTATLAVGPNPTTFGTAVTMTETIPVVNGIPPTGTVTFSDNGTVIGTGTINAQGIASYTTTTLPVGTDPITASYPGDKNYTNVNSGPVNEVVNKANGSDTLAVNPDPAVFGTTVTITDTVPTVGGVAPTGTVTFTNNGTTIGTATIINGVATLTTTTLPVGTDPISGAYSGDGNYAPITAGPVNETITAGNTMPVLGASPNPTTFGTTVTLTESIPGINGVTPTGTVKFFYNGTQIGTGSVPVVNGVATLPTSTLPIGTDPITATYSGDTNYATANSGPLNVVVNKAAPVDTVTSAPNPSTFGVPVTITFTVPVVNAVAPTGVVTFLYGTTPIGTGNVSAAGIATLTISTLPVGSDPITAQYPGDNTYAPESPTTTQVVGKATGIGDTLASNPNPSVFGSPVIITETLPTVGGVAPSGTVTFYYPAGTAIGTVAVSNGTASITTSTLPVGTDPITATYSGDNNYATVNSGPDNQVVGTATAQATLAVGPNPATFGTPVTISETLIPVNGVCPPGPVSFFSNGTLIGTGTVNSGCVATVTTSTLPVGTDAITATAPASGSFAAVTSGPVAEVINKANGPDTLTTSPNPSTFGQNVTITDTIPTVGGVAPTGTVNFYDFGTLIGTGTVTNGVATLVTATLPVGTDSITGVYQGDGNYAVVTAGPVNQVVTAVSTTATLAVGPNPTTFGTAVTITETIPIVNGKPATGTVTFSNNGAVIGTGAINAQGVATFTTTTLPVGTDPITASYPGDTNYTNVNSGPVNEIVNKANGPDVLAVSPDPAVFGTTVTITDTVPTVGGVAPTGTVTFTNNGTTIGTAPIINGVATLTTTTLPVGSDPISGAYGGDGNYAPITTGPVNEIITVLGTIPVLGATPNPTTFGTPVTITESIPGINGVTPTGTVNFFDNGTAIGTGTVTNGVATLVTSTLPIGTDPITATYSGDKNYGTANSGPLNVVVNKAAPTDTVVGAPNPSTSGTPVTLTFTVPLINGVPPTGVVTFYNGTTPIGTGTVNASGIATLTTSSLPIGTDTITAKYPGDNTYSPASPTTTVTVNVVSGTGDTLTASPNPTTFGNPDTLTFCIPVVSGAAAPTGTVTFSVGGTTINTPVTIGTTPVNGCYVATTTTSNLPVGAPTTVTGTYTPGPGSGYGPDAPSTTVTVAPVNPTSVLTYGPTNPTCGSTLVTLTDTITPVNGVVPTGTVQFYGTVNGVVTPLGTPQTVVSPGVATLTIALPCGTTGIYAIYTGLSPYGTSTTPTVPLSLADFSIKATPAAQIVNPGDTTVYTVTLAGVGGVAYTSPVTLTASGLPPGATVAFGTPTLVPGIGPTPTTMTIVTSPTVALNRPTRGNGIYYGLLLLPLLGIRRIRRKIRALPRGISYCLAALLLLGGLGAMTGCSGGYFGGGPNTFTITVTGTSGTVTHSTTVTLTVE